LFNSSAMLRSCCVAVVVAGLVAGCHRSGNEAQKPSAAQTQPAGTAAQGTAPGANAGADAAAASNAAPEAAGQAAPATSSQAAAAPAQTAPSKPAAAAPAPAAVTVPAGTVLAIRLNQRLSVKTARAGDAFTGSVAQPVSAGGGIVIPAGSAVQGTVLRAHKRGRFKGASILQLTLTGVDVNGLHYRIDTRSLTRTKKGKGKRTAAFIGGGSGVGMLIGGVATGGVGLLVGGLAGAGAGTVTNAFTGNRDIDFPAESVVNFRLADALELRQ
jgi:hypothetical protein